MDELRVGSLFTGCFGLDLGLEAAGMRTVWACESDPACRRVLAARRPGVPIVDDVRAVDEGLPYVDVLAGGFPCQDLSYAGKGAGLDGDRSGLWHEFARAVRVLRPRHVVVENVSALASRGLGRVLADLAEAGYVGSWGCVRASDVGAPHRRERLFILASLADPGERGRVGRPRVRGGLLLPDGPEAGRDEGAGSAGARDQDAADADRGRLEERREQDSGPQRPRLEAPRGHDADRRDAAPADADDARLEGREPARRRLLPAGSDRTDWGVYEPAIRRWEAVHGPAPRPVDDRRRLDPRFVEWLMGFPDGWVDVPGVSRTAQLKMLGNAVQVQVGALVGAQLVAHLAAARSAA